MSRDTLGFCTRNLDRVFLETFRCFSWKMPQGSSWGAECWVLFPTDESMASFPDSHGPRGLGQERDKGFSGTRNTQLGT